MDSHLLIEQLKLHMEACGKALEARHLDRSKIIEGQWSQEPDLRAWIEDDTNILCIIARHPDDMHLNGYVAVEIGHPLHGKSLSHIKSKIAFPITNASSALYIDPDTSKIQTILNTNGIWWVGFDFMNLLSDVSPLMASLHAQGVTELEFIEKLSPKATYKDIEFATKRCELLAKLVRKTSGNIEKAQEK